MKTEKTDMLTMIELAQLEPHLTALGFWPDSETHRADSEAVFASVKEHGVKHPLLVSPKENGLGYWVIDGCTRYRAAVDAGLSEVPCVVRTIPSEQVDDEVFISNMERARFGAGLRVMRYLERHANEVIRTAKANRDHSENGAKGGRGNKAGIGDTGFTAEAIADRIKTSKMDVLGGIELLLCRYENKIVEVKDGKRLFVDATEEDRDGVETAYQIVIGGGNLRRWLPAAKGHTATVDKAVIKRPNLHAKATAPRVLNMFKNWPSIDWITEIEREQTEDALIGAMEIMPDFLRAALVRIIIEKWPEHEKQALEKALKARPK